MTLTEVLTRRGIAYRQSHSDPNKVHLDCVFCLSRGKPADTRRRLCIHAKDGWGRCVSCDWRSKQAIGAVLRQLSITDTVLGTEQPVHAQQQRVVLPDDFTPLSDIADDPLDQQALRYILNRGVTRKQIRLDKIGVSYTGAFAYRIIFPIYADKTLRGINARDFTGKLKPKYLLSRGEKWLYRFDPEAETVILSEGVIKALRIARVTNYCSAALLGHDLTNIQLNQILTSKTKHVILYSDPDQAGRHGTVKIAETLLTGNISAPRLHVSVVSNTPGPADEIPLADLRSAVSENVVPYTWHYAVKNLV